MTKPSGSESDGMFSHGSLPPALGQTLSSPGLLLASWFGTGLSPRAPGTVGSLAALPLVWWLLSIVPLGLIPAVALAILVIGVWSATVAGTAWGQVDHSSIVIDEVLGQLIAITIPASLVSGWVADPWLYGIGFCLFRLFDIVKPWPVSWFDRSVKNAWGVMLDDVAAGVWAGFVAVPMLLLVI